MTQTPRTAEFYAKLYDERVPQELVDAVSKDERQWAEKLEQETIELKRQIAERDRQIAEAQQERDAEREERRSRFSLDDLNVDVPCETCGGLGKRLYGSTSTWRHGMGGQAMTADVCDTCWGSGDKNKTWPSHKKAYSATERAEKAESELAAMYKAAEEHAGHELGLWPLGAVAAVGRLESELAALRGRQMDLDAKDWLDTLADADKAMSAVALNRK